MRPNRFEITEPELRKTIEWEGRFVRIFRQYRGQTNAKGEFDKRGKAHPYYSVTVNNEDPESGHWDDDFRYSAGIAFLDLIGYSFEDDFLKAAIMRQDI